MIICYESSFIGHRSLGVLRILESSYSEALGPSFSDSPRSFSRFGHSMSGEQQRSHSKLRMARARRYLLKPNYGLIRVLSHYADVREYLHSNCSEVCMTDAELLFGTSLTLLFKANSTLAS